MSKVREFFQSHHIQLALAAGGSILLLALFSKRVLPHPIPKLAQAFPPFLAVLYEVARVKGRDRRAADVRWWIVAIFVSTALVIGAAALWGGT